MCLTPAAKQCQANDPVLNGLLVRALGQTQMRQEEQDHARLASKSKTQVVGIKLLASKSKTQVVGTNSSAQLPSLGRAQSFSQGLREREEKLVRLRKIRQGERAVK
eukprot:1160352-Pelagomonas_calceolata.AAC.7